MDTEERPTKLRKLDSSDRDGRDPEVAASLFQNASDQPIPAQLGNSKTQEQADQDAEAASPKSDAASDVEIQTEAALREEEGAQRNGEPGKPMSKNQLKKQRKRDEWEAGREYRKMKRKQKTQERRQRKRDARDEAAAQQQGQVEAAGQTRPAEQRPRNRRPVLLPISILIDCGFDELMVEKERISLGSQITRSYSENWRAPFQVHLVVSSWGGVLKARFDTVLEKHYLNWKGVTFEEGDFVHASAKAQDTLTGPRGGKLDGIFRHAVSHTGAEDDKHPAMALGPPSESSDQLASTATSVHNGTADSTPPAKPDNIDSAQPPSLPAGESSPQFHPGEIIYLTSDSPDTLSTLHPYSTYIVGGLVDKNRHKGICYRIACERGIKTAKLPIGEYLDMQSRKVLATNHVVEIMLRYLECGDWGEAFLKVIPKRKGGRLKGQGAEEEEEDNDDDQTGNDNVDEPGADQEGHFAPEEAHEDGLVVPEQKTA